MAAMTRLDKDVLKRKYAIEREKRLRPDGNAQYLRLKGQLAHYLEILEHCRRVGRHFGLYNEGQPPGPEAAFSVGYPHGASAFFDYIDQWREAGDHAGLEFR